jgi:hypothetical protein
VVASRLDTVWALAGGSATYVPPDADGQTLAAAVRERLRTDPVAGLRERAKQHAWPRILREQVVPLILSGDDR